MAKKASAGLIFAIRTSGTQVWRSPANTLFWRKIMNQMNQIVIEGNVVRDSQVKETPRGTRVCLLSIATNRTYKDIKGEYQKEVGFFDVEAWGETFSSRIARLAKKGRGLRIVGRLKQDRWKTQEGKNSSRVSIVAEHIDFQPPREHEKDEAEDKSDAELAAKGLLEETASSLSPDENFDEVGEAVF